MGDRFLCGCWFRHRSHEKRLTKRLGELAVSRYSAFMPNALSFPPDFLEDRLLHRDGVMLVINKPAGLVVHPNPGAHKKGVWQESLEDYLASLQFGLPRRPALAHRLDRDTTGCLVLGRHPKALRKLHKLFFENRVEKTYWAICVGTPKQSEGWIDAPLLKENSKKTGWRVIVSSADVDGARPSRTRYVVRGEKDGLSFIECFPTTGRTHQIRVHLESIGCPILGDPLYGDLTVDQRAQPMMLHAKSITIPIATTKPPVIVDAPPPPTMAEVLENLAPDDADAD